MAILTGTKILEKIKTGDITISDFDMKRLGPNGYNLRLGNKLLVYKNLVLDMKEKNETEEVIIPEEGLVIYPNQLYLGITMEHTETKDLVPVLEGRSSTGRLGLDVHICAGMGENYFKGYWTLEIRCIHPIRIYPGTEVCQIVYHTIDGESTIKYNGKYQSNNDVQASMLYKDFE